MQPIKISIIIPTYKEPDYLKLCLESIKRIPSEQYDNIQVVVVVDGTSELNKSVADQFIKYNLTEYPKLTWLNLPQNSGLPHSLSAFGHADGCHCDFGLCICSSQRNG